MTHHLVGVAEIAEMLGVSRQRVDAITRTDDTFPSPEVELASGRVWTREKVDEWLRARRRSGRGRR
ncbi:MAG TPA: hypothetical protein VF230_00455 [Acidimicrobiales bacterium]